MAGGGAAQQSSGKKKARIEIIPLIDVVFFLLATFVLFTLSLNKIVSVPADLPKAGDAPIGGDIKNLPLIIQVTDAGIYLDKELITERELAPRLDQYKRSTQNPKVLLAGDDRAKFGPTVLALDEVRKAGISQVNIETAYRATGR
jgi:biopolymer transport protein ExbD